MRSRLALALLALLCPVPVAFLGTGSASASWAPDGNPVSTATDQQVASSVIPDRAGGVIVTYSDRRSGTPDAYAQRLTATGDVAPGWPVDGRRLCATLLPRNQPLAVPDGAGGAFVAWENNPTSDLYAQH